MTISNIAKLFTVMCCAALVGCNTVEGAGRDVKSAGGAVEGAAREAK